MRRLAPSIRFRLTGWYALVLSLMMAVYATATFVAVRHEFVEQPAKLIRFMARTGG